MFSNIRIFSLYFAQFLKSRLEYKIDFVADIFANLVTALSGLLFIVFLMDGDQIKTLKGWSREEVFFIYGYSLLPMALFSSVALNLYRFGDRYIIQGGFDRVLLRPLNSLGQILFESFNLESIGSVIVAIFLLVYSLDNLNISFTLVDYLWLLVSSISGATILLSVFVILASLSFHFEDKLGIAAPVFNLIRFGRYPLPIFNKLVQFVLRWIVPFAFVAFYPATHFLRRKEFLVYCYSSPIIAIIFSCLAWVLWQFGVSKYSSTGN